MGVGEIPWEFLWEWVYSHVSHNGNGDEPAGMGIAFHVSKKFAELL